MVYGFGFSQPKHVALRLMVKIEPVVLLGILLFTHKICHMVHFDSSLLED